MYKQKLEEQLKRLEDLQSRCGITDIEEFCILQREILSLATKIDDITTKVETAFLIDGEKIHTEVTKC